MNKKPRPIYCSFCGAPEMDCEVLMAGINALICEKCVLYAVIEIQKIRGEQKAEK